MFNDSTYGLQIIAERPVTRVTLGKNDNNPNVEGERGSLERAVNSYNRVVMTLNEKAEEYMETANGDTLATDARSVGTDPLNKNYPNNLTGEERAAQMLVADSNDTYMNEYNGKLFKECSTYRIDNQRLAKIGNAKLGSYWLAGYRTYMYSEYGYYFSPLIQSGGLNAYGFLQVHPDGTLSEQGATEGFRPVFVLALSVKIIGGEGTEEVPYEIGL